jgi:hypothetical protein
VFLGAYAKLRNALLALPRLSVRPHGATRPPLDGFTWNDIFQWFFKVSREFFFIQSDKNSGYLYADQFTFLVSHSFLRRMRNVSSKFVYKIEAHILGSVTFFRKSCPLWDNSERYCTAGQVTDDNMVQGHLVLDT